MPSSKEENNIILSKSSISNDKEARTKIEKLIEKTNGSKNEKISESSLGKMILAYNLAKEYGLNDLSAKIENLIKELEKRIKEEEEEKQKALYNIIAAFEKKAFEDSLKKDLFGTAKKYFASTEVASALNISESINNGTKVETKDLVELAELVSDEKHIHHRKAIANAVSVKKEELKLQLEQTQSEEEKAKIKKDLSQSDEYLRNAATLEIDHQVINKHKDKFLKEHHIGEVSHKELMKHKGNVIQQEIKEVVEVIEKHVEGGLTAVGTLVGNIEQTIRDFVLNPQEKLEDLKQAIHIKKQESQDTAIEKLQQEVVKQKIEEAKEKVDMKVAIEDKMSQDEGLVRKNTLGKREKKKDRKKPDPLVTSQYEINNNPTLQTTPNVKTISQEQAKNIRS